MEPKRPMSDDENVLDLEAEDEEDDFDPEFDEDLDDDDEDPLSDDDEEEHEEDDEDEEAPPERNAKRPAATDGEFDDEVDPDNLEADLNTILRDRIAAGDDITDDEADEVETGQPAEMLGSVTPRRDDEWLCEGCFLLVTLSQLGTRSAPHCPSGEEICPSLNRLGL
ncbi:MAG: hypothetical protein OXH20_09735 [bacterium]|nr:hypothetical protein [bacterium]